MTDKTNGRVNTLLKIALGVLLGMLGWALQDRLTVGVITTTNATRITELDRRATMIEQNTVSTKEFQSEIRRLNDNQQSLMVGQERLQNTLDSIQRSLARTSTVGAGR